MQRVSMPSDLAATSPLLLQLLIPQGFTLQSRPAQTQSQTQAPWLQRDLLLTRFSPRSRPLDQPCSHTPVPGTRNNTPTFDFFFSCWLQQTAMRKAKQWHCWASPVSWVVSQYERCSMLRSLHIWSGVHLKRYQHKPPPFRLLSLSPFFCLCYTALPLFDEQLVFFFFAWNALIQRRKQAFNVLYIGDATNRDLNYLTMSLRDSKSNMCTKAHPHEKMPVQLVTKFSWGIDSSTCKSISTSPHQYACLVFLTSSRTTVSVDDWGSFSDLRPDHNAIGHCKPLTIA